MVIKRRPRDKVIVYKYVEKNKAKEAEDDEVLEKNAQMAYFLRRHEREMNKHSRYYGNILKSYSENVEPTLKMKRRFKWIFFVFAILSLAFTLGLFAYITTTIFDYVSEGKNNLSIIATLLSSLVSIVTIYNVIPEIIAKYLFNIEEDENMTKFIEKMQSYDSGLIKYMNSSETRIEESQEIFNDSLEVGYAEVPEE